MQLIIDIEANGLESPDKIWCIVTKDVDTGEIHVYRQETLEEFKTLCMVERPTLIGHFILGYDLPVLHRLLGIPIDVHNCFDTAIISKLVDYSRPQGHAIEDYGLEFGLEKIKFSDFSKWSQEMEDYCVRDVEIGYLVYNRFKRIISDPVWRPSILLEQRFQLIVNDLHDNGFAFNTKKATQLLEKVTKELAKLDEAILKEFPPKLKPIREIHPKETKHGTLNRSDFRWVTDGDLSCYNGGPFTRCSWSSFNPSSHKQIIEVLNKAGWSPVNKTQTHIDKEREYNRLKYTRNKDPGVDLRLKVLYDGLQLAKSTGWKVDEANLSTLPESAPAPARTLAKRILFEARRRSLTEWLGLVREDGRIHGQFFGIGAWTHRMAHQKPNTANIPREFTEDGSTKLLGKEMRQLWVAPKNRLLVGVDAEGIQLRIFAHYIQDEEFTDALVRGRKSDKTDPHSLNQRVLGSNCKSRQAAKRFIYALLLGAGIEKLAQILGCSKQEAEEALARLLDRYQGFAELKEKYIPADARRGYFIGLDGRKVGIPGETEGSRKHLCMSGYLQNGEAIIIKRAAIITDDTIKSDAQLKGLWKFVNIVHDELQSEVKNDMAIAKRVAQIKANAIKAAGEELKLRCPMAGSYWNDDLDDYTIGCNWFETH